MNEAIKDKIRKMLAMAAKGSGATEEEADTAMRLASGLMARYGIAAEEIGETKETLKAIFGQRINRKFNAHSIILAQTAGLLLRVQASHLRSRKGRHRVRRTAGEYRRDGGDFHVPPQSGRYAL